MFENWLFGVYIRHMSNYPIFGKFVLTNKFLRMSQNSSSTNDAIHSYAISTFNFIHYDANNVLLLEQIDVRTSLFIHICIYVYAVCTLSTFVLNDELKDGYLDGLCVVLL